MTTEVIDTEAAQERVQAILEGASMFKPSIVSSQAPAQPPAPNRKPRSDKGVPKKPPADPDEITLKVCALDARIITDALFKAQSPVLAFEIQDQIIAQLQKRLDLLTKQK